jgi:hypothetical protein
MGIYLNNMLTVYIGALGSRLQYLDILFPSLGALVPKNVFGEPYPLSVAKPFFCTTDYAREADAFLLPYNYHAIKARDGDYLRTFIKSAKEHGKPLIVSATGDSTDPVDAPAMCVLRSGAYRGTMQKNDVIVPPQVTDLGALYGVTSKQKGAVPLIGFCGYGAPQEGLASLKFALKDAYASVAGLLSREVAVRRKGIFFRQSAMRATANSPKVKTAYIVRTYHSASAKTIEMEPKTAREEYVKNMKDSDLVLAPKGDGNFSLRFFESLSLGRVPILIDTDVVLPAEDRIHYDDFIIRIPYRDVAKTADIVSAWYASQTNESFAEKQRLAREVFERELFAPHFYETFFNDLEQKIRAGNSM